MTDQLPEPLVPAHVDLRKHDWMPLDVKRLLGSDTWIEAADDPKLGHALMSLWAASWHQIPAGSLPQNEATLARMAFCDSKTWGRYRDRCMKGWTLCSDGRYYHAVVAEKALESWEWMQKRKGQTAAATAAAAEAARLRRESRAGLRAESVTDSVTDPNISQRNAPQRTSTTAAQQAGAAPVVDKAVDKIPDPPAAVEHWQLFFERLHFNVSTTRTAKVVSTFRAWTEAKLPLAIVVDAVKVGDQKIGGRPASPAYYFPIVEELRVRSTSGLINKNPPRQVEIEVSIEIEGKLQRLGIYHGTLPGANAMNAAIQALGQYGSHVQRAGAKTIVVDVEKDRTTFKVAEVEAEREARRQKARSA